MTVQPKTTGSDELTPICFVDGVQAAETYVGVSVRKGGPCPVCHAPVDNVLSFNPTDSYFYFNCVVCGVWVRWCDINGNLVSFTVVTSQKTTSLDNDEDFPLHTGTF